MPIDNFAGRLKGEFRVLNAHLPHKRRSLTELLKEEHPHVTCNDGSNHFFKRKELDYLSQILDKNERDSLLLPLIIEVSPDKNWVIIRSKKGIEAKIFSKVLGMFVVCKQNMITIGKSQLMIVRKVLRTTTQYVFFL
jgi:hypothetical protein